MGPVTRTFVRSSPSGSRNRSITLRSDALRSFLIRITYRVDWPMRTGLTRSVTVTARSPTTAGSFGAAGSAPPSAGGVGGAAGPALPDGATAVAHVSETVMFGSAYAVTRTVAACAGDRQRACTVNSRRSSRMSVPTFQASCRGNAWKPSEAFVDSETRVAVVHDAHIANRRRAGVDHREPILGNLVDRRLARSAEQDSHGVRGRNRRAGASRPHACGQAGPHRLRLSTFGRGLNSMTKRAGLPHDERHRHFLHVADRHLAELL